MTAIEYLEQAKNIDAKIKLGLRELTYWTELENSLRKNGIDEEYDYENGNPVSRCIDIGIKMEDEIISEFGKIEKARHAVMDVIDRIDNSFYQQLLSLRYLYFCSWNEIAVELKLDADKIHYYHILAVKEIEKVMPEENKKKHKTVI